MHRGRKESRAFRRMASTFKRMVADACDRTGDTEAEIADECMLGHKSFLNNMTNGHAPLPVDVLIRFTNRYSDRRGIEELLSLTEHEKQSCDTDTVFSSLMKSQRETMEFHQVALEAMQDSKITPDEIEAIERELNEAITSAKRLAEQCKALRGGTSNVVRMSM